MEIPSLQIRDSDNAEGYSWVVDLDLEKAALLFQVSESRPGHFASIRRSPN
jgi:hypothetical protein